MLGSLYPVLIVFYFWLVDRIKSNSYIVINSILAMCISIVMASLFDLVDHRIPFTAPSKCFARAVSSSFRSLPMLSAYVISITSFCIGLMMLLSSFDLIGPRQPLTEPKVMPLTKDFWKKGYAISTGRTATTAMAIRTATVGI